MSTERKLFTAEIQRLKAQKGEQTAASGPTPGNAEILRTLNELKAEVHSLTTMVKNGGAPEAPEEEASEEGALNDVVAQKQAEVAMLKTELRALAVCIQQTKAEIAALKPSDHEDDRLIAVAFELDAIVNSTERATQQILESSEKIETLTREIQSNVTDNYIGRVTEDILETIVKIFEACNFQDITGQRITKVVRTLKYVEARIIAMIDIWGAEDIAAIDLKVHDARDEESKLLNGPQLENKGISQDEIDRLFG